MPFPPPSVPILLIVVLALLSAGTSASAQDSVGVRQRSLEVGRPADKEESEVGRFVFAGIGIDEYEQPEIWTRLDNAVNDVVAVRDLLTGEFGFEAPDPWILTNEQATAMNIRSLLDEIRNNLQPDDNLVFFFAGHGISVPLEVDGEVLDHTAYIVPVGVKSHAHLAPGQYIEIEWLLRQLSTLPARHVLAVFDSCESGIALTEGGELKARGSTARGAPEELSSRRSRHVITSAMEDQKAWDENTRYPGNSLFTGWLLEGLRRAVGQSDADEPSPDANVDGHLTVSELAQFVTARVSSDARERYGAAQTPDHGTFKTDQRGELVIELATDPFEELYRDAVALYAEQKYADLVSVASEALELREEGPQVSYLRYLRADADGDFGGSLSALQELDAYQADGVAIPMSGGELRTVLRMAERLCKTGGCGAGANE